MLLWPALLSLIFHRWPTSREYGSFLGGLFLGIYLVLSELRDEQ